MCGTPEPWSSEQGTGQSTGRMDKPPRAWAGGKGWSSLAQHRAQQKNIKKKKNGEGGHRVTETSRLPLVPSSHRCGFPVPTAGTAALLFNNQTAQGFSRAVTSSGQLSWVSQTPPGQRLLEAVSRRKRGAARQGGAWCRHPGDGGSPGERDAAPGTCPAPSCQPNPDTGLGLLLPWHSPQQQVPPQPLQNPHPLGTKYLLSPCHPKWFFFLFKK